MAFTGGKFQFEISRHHLSADFGTTQGRFQFEISLQHLLAVFGTTPALKVRNKDMSVSTTFPQFNMSIYGRSPIRASAQARRQINFWLILTTTNTQQNHIPSTFRTEMQRQANTNGIPQRSLASAAGPVMAKFFRFLTLVKFLIQIPFIAPPVMHSINRDIITTIMPLLLLLLTTKQPLVLLISHISWFCLNHPWVYFSHD